MTNPKWEWAGWKRRPAKFESRGYELLVSSDIKTFTFTGKRVSFRIGWRKIYNYEGNYPNLDGVISGKLVTERTPWAIGLETDEGSAQIITADGQHIATVAIDPVMETARLIAAAPELAAALQRFQRK